jgi:hypothetical protein
MQVSSNPRGISGKYETMSNVGNIEQTEYKKSACRLARETFRRNEFATVHRNYFSYTPAQTQHSNLIREYA